MKKMTKADFIEACNEYGSSWYNAFSVSWSTGGSWCDCYGGSGTVSPEAPQELTMLDEFIMKYFPTITFMEGRMIFGAVETKETSCGDYYGGCTYGIQKEITYDTLIKVLERLELLEIIYDSNDA